MVPVWLSSDKLTSSAVILTKEARVQPAPAFSRGAPAAPEVSVSLPGEGRAGAVSSASLSYACSALRRGTPERSGSRPLWDSIPFPFAPTFRRSPPEQPRGHSRAGAAPEESWRQPMQTQFGQPARGGTSSLGWRVGEGTTQLGNSVVCRGTGAEEPGGSLLSPTRALSHL